MTNPRAKSPSGRDDLVRPLIRTIRNQRVILDADLAALYAVPTFRFNEAVKRNADRFPGDFRFQLTRAEFAGLKSQIAISSPGLHGGRQARQTEVGFHRGNR